MDLYAEMAALVAEGRPFVLATVIESAGSTPQKPGSKMVVLGDGGLRGTVGGGAIEHQIIQAARALLESPESTRVIETHLTHELGMCCGGRMKVFLEKHGAPPRLTVFGAGHVARELALLAHRVGFRVTVVDARPEWASAERFPGIELVLKDPADHARTLSGGTGHCFCITTHDHPLDQAVVEAWLMGATDIKGRVKVKGRAESLS